MKITIDRENKTVSVSQKVNLFELYEEVRALVGGDVLLYDLVQEEYEEEEFDQEYDRSITEALNSYKDLLNKDEQWRNHT